MKKLEEMGAKEAREHLWLHNIYTFLHCFFNHFLWRERERDKERKIW